MLDGSQDCEPFNQEITSSDVISAIRRQKTSGKSPDGDKIHPIMLKKLPPAAIDFLTYLYNRVFDTGEWIWTKAYITFIRKAKKPSYTCPGAYRPLSILSYVGKMFERVLEERIRRFCSIEDTIDHQLILEFTS